MPTGIGMLDKLLTYVIGKEIDKTELNVQPLDPILCKVPVPVQTINRTVQVADHRTKGVDLLVGQGATLAGAAKFFVGLWNPKPDWAKALKPAQYEAIGLELFRFGTEVAFQSRMDPTEDNLAHHWATGTLLAVPALLEPSGSTQQLVVDFSQFENLVKGVTDQPRARALAGSLYDLNPFAYPIPYRVVENKKEKDSSLPSPKVVVQHRGEVLTEFAADVTPKSALWRQRLRWNPYAAVVPIIHLLDTASDAGRTELIQAIFDPTAMAIYPDELDRIAQTSAGVVLLRAAFLRSANLPAVAASRNRIAAALGIDAATDLRACDPNRKDPSKAPPLEPPSPASANLNAKRVKGLKFARSFLGRSVAMTWDVYHEWEGPSSLGAMYPDQYFRKPMDNDTKALKAVGNSEGNPLGDDQLSDRLDVINAIFDIEAYADGGRSADKALLSVGMQQFSFHVEKEGTIVFRRVRGLNDLWFDVFLRSAGFDIGAAPLDADNNKININGLQESAVQIEVPKIGRPVASGANAGDFKEAWLIRLSADGKKNQWCVPGTVGSKDGHRAFPGVKDEATEQHTDCHDAFDFKGTRASDFAEQLVARWAVGARLVPAFIHAQMELCVNRFNQLIVAKNALVKVKIDKTHTEEHPLWELLFQDSDNPAITFEALFPSSVHAAAIIDCFINTPAAAIPAARRAYDRAAVGWKAENGGANVDVNDQLFRVRMMLAYLSERRFFTASKTRYTRGRAIDTAPPRVAKILDRLEETTPDWGFTARILRWTDTFHW